MQPDLSGETRPEYICAATVYLALVPDHSEMAASSNSPLSSLDDGGRLIQQMVDGLDEGEAYYWALACQRFHGAVRDRFPNGTRTGPSSVLSSSERFMWAYTALPEGARPPWWGGKLCRLLAAAGQLSALQWARANNCDWNEENTCRAAAGGGHLEVLQWLCANGCDWDEGTCGAAAAGGHLEVLQWAGANGCPEPSTYSDSDY